MRPLFRYLFVFLLLGSSCNSPDNVGRKKIALADLPQAQPEAFFLAIKGVESKTTDSIYNVVIDGLLDANRVNLLAEHLLYYDKLKGNRKTAAALMAQAQGWVANYYGHYDSSLKLFHRAADAYLYLGDTTGLARSYFGIGVNNMYLGNYPEMFTYNLKAIRLFESTRDSANLYEVKLELANGFSVQREFEQAIDLLQSCLDYYTRKQQPDAMAYCQSMFSKVYGKMGDPHRAISYAEAALASRERSKDTIGISASLNNIASEYLVLKQYEKALEVFQKSLVLVRIVNDKRQELIVQQNIANCLESMGRHQEAETLLLQLVDIGKQRGQKFTLANSYNLLARATAGQAQYRASLTYYQLYKAYSDSLFDEEKAKANSELLIKYETAKKEAHIALLIREKELGNTRKWLYLSLLLLTLLSFIFVVLFLRSKHKANKLKLEQATLELENNTRALNSFTERIIRKNEQIEALEEQVRHNRQMADEAVAEEQNSEQLSRLYQLKILTEEDWQNFKMLFDKVHPGFINKLRMQFPEIAASEERQSLLIKLNINNKEGAAMLGISPDGVKKNRYRLKKRFLLNEEANLDEFVRSL